MHSIWMALVVPSMIFLVWGFPALRKRRVWGSCLALACLVIVTLVGVDLQRFLADGGASGDSVKRAIYLLATSTNYPLIAFFVGSVVNLACCSFRSQEISEAEPGDDVAAMA